MNIQLTDKVVFDTVVKLHSNSSILKEEVKKRVYAEHGIKTTVATAEEMKGFERQLRKFESNFQNIQESIGNLEANRILKRMDDKAYKTAVARMTYPTTSSLLLDCPPSSQILNLNPSS